MIPLVLLPKGFMTLEQAKDFAFEVFPGIGNEVLSAESLVRRTSDCFCLENKGRFEVYADGVLIGDSVLGPGFAWIDAAQNLPYEYLREFEEMRTVNQFPDALRVYYRRRTF
jgi:hypothetical protein